MDQTTPSIPHDFDVIADECLQFLEHDEEKFVDDLLMMNGSSAGATPKILISLKNQDQFDLTDNNPSSEHHDWIVKFKSSVDPKDIGSIEYAYHLMAVEAGLDVPKAKLFKSRKCEGYFGVKRFDRVGKEFLHMHTASGLLHADYRLPSLDYQTLLKATLALTKDVREVEKQFRHAVFNVFSHNRDDHAKNFCFLMKPNGQWLVSPAFDLTFSSGPAGEHSTSIMGEGKNPGTAHLLKLAEVGMIKNERAIAIIDRVKHAVSQWNNFAKEAHVSRKSSKHIHAVLSKLIGSST